MSKAFHQDILSCPPSELHIAFYSEHVFYEWIIQKWDPYFEGVSHTHPVDLCQHIARQESLNVHIQNQIDIIIGKTVFFRFHSVPYYIKVEILIRGIYQQSLSHWIGEYLTPVIKPFRKGIAHAFYKFFDYPYRFKTPFIPRVRQDVGKRVYNPVSEK